MDFSRKQYTKLQCSRGAEDRRSGSASPSLVAKPIVIAEWASVSCWPARGKICACAFLVNMMYLYIQQNETASGNFFTHIIGVPSTHGQSVNFYNVTDSLHVTVSIIFNPLLRANNRNKKGPVDRHRFSVDLHVVFAYNTYVSTLYTTVEHTSVYSPLPWKAGSGVPFPDASSPCNSHTRTYVRVWVRVWESTKVSPGE